VWLSSASHRTACASTNVSALLPTRYLTTLTRHSCAAALPRCASGGCGRNSSGGLLLPPEPGHSIWHAEWSCELSAHGASALQAAQAGRGVEAFGTPPRLGREETLAQREG
jgi:hypothetical protein